MEDADRDVRRNAAQALGEMGPAAADASPALCRALGSRDAVMRGHARDALVGMDSAAVAALIDSLKAEDTGLRQRAADILRWIGESAKEAVPALTQALEDPDYRVRRRAELALEKIGPVGPAEPSGAD